MKRTIILAGTLLALAGTQVQAAPPPIEDFIRHSTYSSVRISPTGKYFALTVDRGDQDVLVVLDAKTLAPLKVNILPNEASVGQFFWTSPERLMFNSVRKVGSYAQPFGTGEWYAVNADGSQSTPLIFRGSRGATERTKTVGSESFSLLDTLEDDDRHVLMLAISPRSQEGVGTAVVQLDTTSGRRKVLARAPRENCSIALDRDKQARFAICSDYRNDAGEYDSWSELYRRGDDGKWTLLNRSQDSGQEVSIAGVAEDGRIYATRSDRKGTLAFGTLDRQTGEFEQLFHDPVSDPAGYVVASDGDTVLGVVTMAGLPKVTLIEEEHPDAKLYQSLSSSFPGQWVNFSGATQDGNQIVVTVASDRNPGELYLYDRKSGQARFLMQARKWVDPEQMATVEPFSFTARDGTRLYGYLTVPKGAAGKRLPMIVNPHGGPMGPRDYWGYNWETQLLASRGYLVLQVNFRGSGGFGKAFMDQAYGQWATGIMNDIVDATQWAIDAGHAEAGRVCIYGGSFGGYAAMMGPARAPELYQCAFGYVGGYSTEIQLKLSDTSESEAGRMYRLRAYGATKAEQDAMSAVNFADRIDVPVYLAAGARDPRCPPENTEAMFEALKRAGNEPEGMIIQSGEMHGFYEEESRLKLYTEMLAFFDRHIGAAAEKPAGP